MISIPFVIRRLGLSISLLILSGTCHTENQSMSQTQNKLKQLENKMSQLQQHISNSHIKQDKVKKELSILEKKIHDGTAQLKKIQLIIENKQQQIIELQKKIDTLDITLHNQQHLLGKQIYARYKISHATSTEWLFNQDAPYRMNHLLTLHHYLLQSRKKNLAEIRKIKQNLDVEQSIRQNELANQEQLQQQLGKLQKEWDSNKQKQTNLLTLLARDISRQQNTLTTYQQNKQNLSRLLSSLNQKSLVQNRHPFNQMRKKLKKPISVNHHGFQKLNQGIIFFADEGTPVSSVFSGKIVFSNWLNGYGLLLIIDHGKGFMTLYGNNSSIIKHKGDIVYQDEKIATVGRNSTLKKSGLYFEIRHRGKAINPLEWVN